MLSTSTAAPSLGSPSAPTYNQTDTDPWSLSGSVSPTDVSSHPATLPGIPHGSGGAPVTLTGELGVNWWQKQSKVEVSILPVKKGFILARYTAYMISSDVCDLSKSHHYTPTLNSLGYHLQRGAPVTRRYSDFVYLFDCFIKRYPFRIIPSLPPKRLGGTSDRSIVGILQIF